SRATDRGAPTPGWAWAALLHSGPASRKEHASLVVRRPAQNLERAVQLLEHDHAGQSMRQRQRREAPDETRLVADSRGKALVAADAEGQVLRAVAESLQAL